MPNTLETEVLRVIRDMWPTPLDYLLTEDVYNTLVSQGVPMQEGELVAVLQRLEERLDIHTRDTRVLNAAAIKAHGSKRITWVHPRLL